MVRIRTFVSAFFPLISSPTYRAEQLRSVTIWFILLAISRSYGQRNLSVVATLSPTYVHTTYINRSFYPESDGHLVEPIFINGVRGTAGYSAGVGVRYNWTPAWSVSSGFWYSQHSIRQDRLPLAGDGTTTLRERALRIPLSLDFRSSAKRLSPYFSFGWLIDLPLTTHVLVAIPGQAIQRQRLLTGNGPIFQLFVGTGIQYTVTPRYSFSVQPAASYSLGRFGGYASHNDTYALSLQTQVQYSF